MEKAKNELSIWKEIRNNANISQIEIAEKIHVSRNSVGTYEKENGSMPLDVMKNWLEVCNVSTEQKQQIIEMFAEKYKRNLMQSIFTKEDIMEISEITSHDIKNNKQDIFPYFLMSTVDYIYDEKYNRKQDQSIQKIYFTKEELEILHYTTYIDSINEKNNSCNPQCTKIPYAYEFLKKYGGLTKVNHMLNHINEKIKLMENLPFANDNYISPEFKRTYTSFSNPEKNNPKEIVELYKSKTETIQRKFSTKEFLCKFAVNNPNSDFDFCTQKEEIINYLGLKYLWKACDIIYKSEKVEDGYIFKSENLYTDFMVENNCHSLKVSMEKALIMNELKEFVVKDFGEWQKYWLDIPYYFADCFNFYGFRDDSEYKKYEKLREIYDEDPSLIPRPELPKRYYNYKVTLSETGKQFFEWGKEILSDEHH